MAVNPEITGKNASFTFPTGIAGKAIRWTGTEEFKEVNNTGAGDNGFYNGKIVNQRFSGSVLFHVNASVVGAGVVYENVAAEFIMDTGRKIAGNFNLTRMQIVGDASGDIVPVTADFASNGTYTNTGL